MSAVFVISNAVCGIFVEIKIVVRDKYRAKYDNDGQGSEGGGFGLREFDAGGFVWAFGVFSVGERGRSENAGSGSFFVRLFFG